MGAVKDTFLKLAEFDTPKKPQDPKPVAPGIAQKPLPFVRTMGQDPIGVASSAEAQRIYNPNLPPMAPMPAGPPIPAPMAPPQQLKNPASTDAE